MERALQEPQQLITGWGMRDRARGHLARPADTETLAAMLAEADARGVHRLPARRRQQLR